MTTNSQAIASHDLLGHWRLMHFVYRWPDGRELAPLGAAQGQLIYLANAAGQPDRMAVQVVADERPPLDPASEASLAAHFRSGFAYGGRWSLAGRTVRHDVDIASLVFWQGARLSRDVDLDGERLILSTDEPSPQLPEGGYRTLLEWAR
nr:lipocalin-like domain-containing protein [uncultured Halomonas sp.]